MTGNRGKRGMAKPLTLTLMAIGVLVLLCLIFPGVLAFVEMAARELRYFWWLVLMVAVGVYLIFFFGKSRKN
ncbi:MAG: hypothetical protein LBH01_06120 [Verrucomicrobiales bacterium]|jgi:hypothetical protein|nr:hypothetical protein [Verrucomicrobiales bacterium]